MNEYLVGFNDDAQQCIHPSSVGDVHISVFPHCLLAQQEEPPWGAGPRFEPGPALQQASALPSELRCTLKSYAAPY
jgi:hypothetical protein